MQLFNFSKDSIEEKLFKNPNAYRKDLNKIQGGLWCSLKNDYYSDWVIVEMLYGVAQNQGYIIAEGNVIELKENARILKLTIDNYKDIDLSDIEKIITSFDAIHFDKELVENIKEFEAYYVESFQLLNLDCIKTSEHVFVENDVITLHQAEVLTKFFELEERIKNTEYYKQTIKNFKEGDQA